jgi:ATP citrate (pro-S)-lyase
MLNINHLRGVQAHIVLLGSHSGIIQSILDYDYLIDREVPSIVGIIAHGRKQERYFWGEKEIFLPVAPSIEDLGDSIKQSCNMLINVQSARRILSTTKHAIDVFPNLIAINIFAEQTPEMHTIELAKLCTAKKITLIGPSSVGLLLPGHVKLGAIGGTQHPQISTAGILEDGGDVAVISTSGGMVNELIHTVTASGHSVSFAIALGGDLFPATTPAEAFLMAQEDPQTKRIVYFGELGGSDEYEIVKLIKAGQITKEVTAYIAGTVAELFDTPPQFGHAKAMAKTYNESASAKKQALEENGVYVCGSFADLGRILKEQISGANRERSVVKSIDARRKGLVVSHISGTKNGDVHLLGRELMETVGVNTLSSLILSMILGKQIESQKLIDFTDCTLKLLVDHGPQVSGAVNTIVAARAGKDLVSSLTAGLLTIGPRFGGAINAAAGHWLDGVEDGLDGKKFVDTFKSNDGIIPGIGHKKYRLDMPDPRVAALSQSNDGIIPGIGHKKYRLDMPDPRVAALSQFAANDNGDTYLKFARSVEQITTAKKGNLILNIDGAIAALMLDILQSELHMTPKELRHLVDIEFFNALFVLSRSIGFTAHYLDQRRHDEGLLRLPDDDVRYIG